MKLQVVVDMIRLWLPIVKLGFDVRPLMPL